MFALEVVLQRSATWSAVEASRKAALRNKKEKVEKRLYELEQTVKGMAELLVVLCTKLGVEVGLSSCCNAFREGARAYLCVCCRLGSWLWVGCWLWVVGCGLWVVGCRLCCRLDHEHSFRSLDSSRTRPLYLHQRKCLSVPVCVCVCVCVCSHTLLPHDRDARPQCRQELQPALERPFTVLTAIDHVSSGTLLALVLWMRFAPH
jgi:hypothetical protein